MLGSKINIYPHISIPGDLCHYCPKKLQYRPFSYSTFVYIFGGATTSDGVQCSVCKPLYCTPSDVLARRNM